MVKVTVVTVFYNRESLVKQTMDSLLNQSFKSYQIIAVDDGSIDSTILELNKYSELDNVTIIRQENKGFVKTMRSICSNIDSDYIAIHGSGDISLPNRLELQYQHLEKYPSVAVVGCLINKVYLDDLNKNDKIYGTSFCNEDYSKKILQVNPFSHGEVMFRRKDYLAAGGYREFFRFSQDRDLWCRMSRQGSFTVLDSLQYERMVAVPGSVTGSQDKTLQQRYYTEFALHLHRCFENDQDPLDRLGHFSALLFNDRNGIRKQLRQYALRHSYNNLHPYDNKYLTSYRKESKYWQGVLLFIFCLIVFKARKFKVLRVIKSYVKK